MFWQKAPPPVFHGSTWAKTLKLHRYIVQHKRIRLPKSQAWSRVRTCILQTANWPGPGPFEELGPQIFKMKKQMKILYKSWNSLVLESIIRIRKPFFKKKSF